MREGNKIKYIKCNICGFQKEDMGCIDPLLTHNKQSYTEMEEHKDRA